jgi:hypothetical protein
MLRALITWRNRSSRSVPVVGYCAPRPPLPWLLRSQGVEQWTPAAAAPRARRCSTTRDVRGARQRAEVDRAAIAVGRRRGAGSASTTLRFRKPVPRRRSARKASTAVLTCTVPSSGGAARSASAGVYLNAPGLSPARGVLQRRLPANPTKVNRVVRVVRADWLRLPPLPRHRVATNEQQVRARCPELLLTDSPDYATRR